MSIREDLSNQYYMVDPEWLENEDDKIVFNKFRPYLAVLSQILWRNSSENIIEDRENWMGWNIWQNK